VKFEKLSVKTKAPSSWSFQVETISVESHEVNDSLYQSVTVLSRSEPMYFKMSLPLMTIYETNSIIDLTPLRYIPILRSKHIYTISLVIYWTVSSIYLTS